MILPSRPFFSFASGLLTSSAVGAGACTGAGAACVTGAGAACVTGTAAASSGFLWPPGSFSLIFSKKPFFSSSGTAGVASVFTSPSIFSTTTSVSWWVCTDAGAAGAGRPVTCSPSVSLWPGSFSWSFSLRPFFFFLLITSPLSSITSSSSSSLDCTDDHSRGQKSQQPCHILIIS
uniref:Secreted protein n=1 Tax=Triticum urartu TaxID=4572 RepID=A0A8R7UTJ1_TRIUA